MVLTAFASSLLACGDVELPMTLALTGDDNFMELTIAPGTPFEDTARIDLYGGLETTMTAGLGIMQLIYKWPIDAVVELDDLLFAGTPFLLRGNNTGSVCAIPDWDGPNGGTAVIDQIFNRAHFVMDVSTKIVVENALLTQLMPDGVPLSLAVDETSRLTFFDLVALILGNTEGIISITQEIDQQVSVILFGSEVPIDVVGELNLTTVTDFPDHPLIDDCIVLIIERGY